MNTPSRKAQIAEIIKKRNYRSQSVWGEDDWERIASYITEVRNRNTQPSYDNSAVKDENWKQAYETTQQELIRLREEIDRVRKQSYNEGYKVKYEEAQRELTELRILKVKYTDLQNSINTLVVNLYGFVFGKPKGTVNGLDAIKQLTVAVQDGTLEKRFEDRAIEKAKKQLREMCDAI